MTDDSLTAALESATAALGKTSGPRKRSGVPTLAIVALVVALAWRFCSLATNEKAGEPCWEACGHKAGACAFCGTEGICKSVGRRKSECVVAPAPPLLPSLVAMLPPAPALSMLPPAPALALLLPVLLLAALSSPLAVVKLLFILAKTPYYALRSIAAFLAPSLFYKSVAGEVTIVTGGAGGIGKLVAQRLCTHGSSVVLLDKDGAALDRAVVDVRAAAAANAKCFTVECDLSDREATYIAMRRAQELAGPCTLLINNAGIVTGKKLLDGSDKLQELTMAVNATAHFWTVKSVLPAMIEANHGHIVTIASSAGMLGVAGLADYCASKAAALRFDESIRLEMRKMGKTGVHTTVVCPFFIKTGMFDGVQAKWPRLLPLLEPEWAADKIVSAIRCNQWELLMPRILHIVPVLRGLLPLPICADLAEWFGVLDTMDDFKGRAPAQA